MTKKKYSQFPLLGRIKIGGKAMDMELWFRESFCVKDSVDILSLMEAAITVAAFKHPEELSKWRSTIINTLLSLKPEQQQQLDDSKNETNKSEETTTTLKTDDHQTTAVTYETPVLPNGVSDGESENKVTRGILETKDAKQSKRDNHSQDNSETLSINKESTVLDKFLKIKAVLDNSDKESHDVLFDSLKRLQRMNVSLEILEVTKIGRSVSALKKHKSEDISDLAKIIVSNWKIMTEKWLEANADTDGMDDDVEFNKKTDVSKSKSACPKYPSTNPKHGKVQTKTNDEPMMKQNQHKQKKIDSSVTKAQQNSDKGTIQKKQLPPQKKVSDCNNEASLEVKLGATKRKLHERYQETAKKQRTTRLLEIHEAPKPHDEQRNQNTKTCSHSRRFAK